MERWFPSHSHGQHRLAQRQQRRAASDLWQIDGQLVSSEATYVSGEVVVESSNDLPIGAIVLGLALGGAAVLLLRLQGQRGSASTKRITQTFGSTPTPTKVASNEKREVSCPECDRRLRVPVSYAGTVGCPDCSHKFAVEAQAAPAPSSTSTPDPDDDDEVVEVQEEAEPTPAEKVEVVPGVRTNTENPRHVCRLCSLSSLHPCVQIPRRCT